jgi:hypothetical protein
VRRKFIMKKMLVLLCACGLGAGMLFSRVGSMAYATTSPSPVAAPTVRPATAKEQASFLGFAPAKSKSKWQLDGYAVAGPYAFFGIYNPYSGQTGLAYYENGKWVLKTLSGGQVTIDDIFSYFPGIPSSTAQALYALYMKQDHSTPQPTPTPTPLPCQTPVAGHPVQNPCGGSPP